jgi:flagellar motility protein MotE (MotC chaperone)
MGGIWDRFTDFVEDKIIEPVVDVVLDALAAVIPGSVVVDGGIFIPLVGFIPGGVPVPGGIYVPDVGFISYADLLLTGQPLPPIPGLTPTIPGSEPEVPVTVEEARAYLSSLTGTEVTTEQAEFFLKIYGGPEGARVTTEEFLNAMIADGVLVVTAAEGGPGYTLDYGAIDGQLLADAIYAAGWTGTGPAGELTEAELAKGLGILIGDPSAVPEGFAHDIVEFAGAGGIVTTGELAAFLNTGAVGFGAVEGQGAVAVTATGQDATGVTFNYAGRTIEVSHNRFIPVAAFTPEELALLDGLDWQAFAATLEPGDDAATIATKFKAFLGDTPGGVDADALVAKLTTLDISATRSDGGVVAEGGDAGILGFLLGDTSTTRSGLSADDRADVLTDLFSVLSTGTPPAHGKKAFTITAADGTTTTVYTGTEAAAVQMATDQAVSGILSSARERGWTGRPMVSVDRNDDGSYSVIVRDADSGIVLGAADFSVSEPGRRHLVEVDGTVEGTTEGEVAFDASSERVAVLWQALLDIGGGKPPNMTAEEVFAYLSGLYLGPDVKITDEQLATFFEKNLNADGTLKVKLDLSMFEGIDKVALTNLFTDGAQLFHALQQSYAATDPDQKTRLLFSATPGSAQQTFFNALQADIFETRTTSAADDTQWQDFLASGVTSSHDVATGHYTEEDLANDSLVKALLWVGTDVIDELEAKGLWNGPSAAELDSPDVAEKYPVYDVIYTPAGSTEQVRVTVEQAEYDVLLKKHKDGEITFGTDNIASDYASSPAQDSELGANYYTMSYYDESGALQTKTGVPLAERDALIARHERGEIIIIPPKVKDPSLVRLFWAEKAIAVYDQHNVPVMDENGNVVSGGGAMERVAQAYNIYYEHYLPATDSYTYGPFGRTGTSYDALMADAPTATTSTKTDGEAISFMFSTLGGSPTGNNDIFGAFASVKGITDIVHVAAHWAQGRPAHPDHTTFEWFADGNKERGEDAASDAEAALVARRRSTGNVDHALTDTEEEIRNHRILSGLTLAITLVSLGTDAALITAVRATFAEGAVEFTSEEAVSLLQESYLEAIERGSGTQYEEFLGKLSSSGMLSDVQLTEILAQSPSSNPTLWQAIGASGAGYASAGAGGLAVGQYATSGQVVPISTPTGEVTGVTGEAGLSPKEHIDAINLAVEVNAAYASGGAEAAAAVLFGPEHGHHEGVVEQTLELLPPELRAEMVAYRDRSVDPEVLSTLIAAGDPAAIAAYLEGLPSAAQQYAALVQIINSGNPELALQVLEAMKPESAANILIYEQSIELNSTETVDGKVVDPLDTRGPLFTALMNHASNNPETFKTDFGDVMTAIGVASPDTAAHMIYTAYTYRGSTDGTGENADLAATLLGSLDDETALKVLNSLDELQVDNGPRRELGESSGFEWVSLAILGRVMFETGDVSLTFKHLTSGSYQHGNVTNPVFTEYAATNATAKSQVDLLQTYLTNPFAAFDNPIDGANLGEFALAQYGYDNAAKLLNDMTPEEAAANLDKVSSETFTYMIAGMDPDKALAAQPFLKASKGVLSDDEVASFAQTLADLTGVDVSIITGLLNGTISFDDVVDNGAYMIIPTLIRLIESGDPTAIKFVNEAVDKLIAAGGSGDPGDPGWGANELAFLEDLRDAATGTGDYSAPNPDALASLFGVLSGPLGAAFQFVTEAADLKYIPQAVQDTGLDGLLEQNPELQDVLDNSDEIIAQYLTDMQNSDEGRRLLESYGYVVIDGELYHAPRELQANTTDNPSGNPSGPPSSIPSWSPSSGPTSGPSSTPSDGPSSTPSSAPVKVTEEEAANFYRDHVRIDVAVEVTLFVGPGASVRQFRAFVTIPTSKDEHGNKIWGLRLRQLTAFAPESPVSPRGAGNWMSQQDILATAGTGAPTTGTGDTISFADRIGIPRRSGTVFGDLGFTSVKDFVIPFIYGEAFGPGRTTGFQEDVRYQSFVSFAGEVLNAENSYPNQIYNWFNRTFGGSSTVTYPGTDIPETEVVSLRHATANLDSAEERYNTAVENVRRYEANNDVVEQARVNLDEAYADLLAAEAEVKRLEGGISALDQEFAQIEADKVDSDPEVSAAFEEMNAAQTNLDTAESERDLARDQYLGLVADGHPADSPLVIAAKERLDAAEAKVAICETEFASAEAKYEGLVNDLALNLTDRQSAILVERAALEVELTDARVVEASAVNTLTFATDTYTTVSNQFALQNDDYAAALTELEGAGANFFARNEQFDAAQQYRNALNGAGNFLRRIPGNADYETGTGVGIGAIYHFTTRDPDTGDVSFNNGAFWSAVGDVGASAVGGQFLNWGIGALVTNRFGSNPPPAQAVTYVNGIRTDYIESSTFFSSLLSPSTNADQGVKIAGGLAGSLIWSQSAATVVDNVDRAGGWFYWAAAQWRLKFKDQSFGPFGDYTGKGGGRVQVNVGYDFPFN